MEERMIFVRVFRSVGVVVVLGYRGKWPAML